MASHAIAHTSVGTVQKSVNRLGFWSALLLALAAAAALGIAVTTAPPRSGPFCIVDPCVVYPYTDAAAFVPIDYLWMYPALLMGPLLVVLVGCLHAFTPTDKQLFSLVALVFAGIAAATLAINYFIQLTVMQPSLLKGEVEGLAPFSQYNPRGVFIALEDIGYLMMSVTFLFAAAALERIDRLVRMIRALFVSSGGMGISALIILALWYGSELEYHYEVVSILINWIALIIAGALFSLFFSRTRHDEP